MATCATHLKGNRFCLLLLLLLLRGANCLKWLLTNIYLIGFLFLDYLCLFRKHLVRFSLQWKWMVKRLHLCKTFWRDGSTDNSIGWFGDCSFDSCIKYEGSEPYLVHMGSRMIWFSLVTIPKPISYHRNWHAHGAFNTSAFQPATVSSAVK